MTHIIENTGKAMTAIAAVLAFQITQSLAQDTSAPSEPAAETSAQTPETVDPLAPEPTAEESPAATDAAAPPAPRPKVETNRATAQRAKPASRNTAGRSTVRRASPTAPAAVTAAPATEAAAPAPIAAEPQPPAAVEPAPPPPIAEPAPAASENVNTLMSDLMADDMLPVTGAVALGLFGLAGAGVVMHRRKRRRENEEFEARQRALAEIEPEPVLELGPTEEVRTGPVFTRPTAPIHDPVPDKSGLVTTRAAVAPVNIPARSNWQPRSDADFLLRRADKNAKRPVEQD
jgi:hypothetical protein